MKRLLPGLFDHFRAHHDHGRPILQWIGWFGVVAWPTFYMLRRLAPATSLHRLYDDLPLRIAATLLCLLLGLRNYWPQRLKPYYMAYAWATLCFGLSGIMSWSMLKNGGGTGPIVNMVLGAILIILLADWRNAIALSLTGYVLSFGVFWLTHDVATVPGQFIIAAAASMLVVTAGALSHAGQKRAELERLRLVYAGLAGSIAHEMRHPLAQFRHTLDSLGDTLRETGRHVDVDPKYSAKISRTLKQGHEAVTRGLQAIDVTLKQLSPSALDQSRFSYLSAGESVRKAVSEYAFDTEEQRLKVEVHERGDFLFKGEQTVFMLVIFNLLKNALYYLPLRADMRVDVFISNEPEHTIVVRDTGPGIRREVRDRLFQEFATSGKAGGTGLGLAFCRRVLRAFGGEITCQSMPGEFTEFTLSFAKIPAAEVEGFQRAQADRAKVLLAGKRVLVVDDERVSRAFTAARLAGLGTEVEEASDGSSAIKALHGRPFDLVLMDINMPNVDGYQVTRMIREGVAPGGDTTIVIGYSAARETETALFCRRAGMNGFITKGASASEFAQAVVRVVEQGAGSVVPKWHWADISVLVVDDNTPNRLVVRATLQALGMTVSEATHGEEALRILNGGLRPSVILMDINMPGLNGIETTQELRKMAGNVAATPVIALTGNSSPVQTEAARAAGMGALLTKPLDVAALQLELARLLPSPGGRERPSPTAAPEPLQLVSAARVAEFQRLGILEPLITSCLSELSEALEAARRAAMAGDMEAALSAVHSLLGISSEAGAQVLQKTARSYHAILSDGHWPQDGWVENLRQVVVETQVALGALLPATAKHAPAAV